MSKLQDVFDGSEDEDLEELHINKKYAEKYDTWRRGEEIQKLKDRLGDDASLSSDSESSSDNEFVEPDNPEFDRDFLVTLGALHKKDIKPDDKFFPGDYRKRKEIVEKEEKAMTIEDYQRHIILDRKGELEEDEHGEISAVELPQEKINNFNDGMSSDDDGGDLFTSGMFKRKETDVKKCEPAVDDAVAFVKGEGDFINNTKDRHLLEGLREAWKNPNLSEDDKWLTDFFLNKRYLEEEDESIEREYNEVVIDEETLSEDEKTLEQMDTFETKYRFRYEEPDQEFIKKYPRIIEDSMRVKDDRRKLHREAVKQRKAQEKEQKKQELLKLQALKYREIQSKIDKIKEVSGTDDIDLKDKDLDDDFDPDAHDAAMSRMFGHEYYEDDTNTDKPVFSDDEDIIKDYDDWMEKEGLMSGGAHEASTSQEGYEGKYEENEYQDDFGEWNEDEDFNMDADFDERQQSQKELQDMMRQASGKKKVRRKSKFAKALKNKKPVFDPNKTNFDSYFDEYYQMNFEDLVDNMPCRYKYRKVESNNFGLTTEEILSAQNSELNRWYSVNKMLRYNRTENLEKCDANVYAKRASQLHVKQKLLPSLFTEDPIAHHVAEEEKKRIKNLKRKLRRQQRMAGGAEEDIENHPRLKPREVNEILEDTEAKNGKRSITDTVDECPKKKKKKICPVNSDASHITETSTSEKNRNNSSQLQKIEEKSNKSSIVDCINTEPAKKKKKEKGKAPASEESLTKNTSKYEGDTNLKTAVLDAKSENDLKNKKKKKKKKSSATSNIPATKKDEVKERNKDEKLFFKGISDARLAAYGQNPKKLKNKVKYRKKES